MYLNSIFFNFEPDPHECVGYFSDKILGELLLDQLFWALWHQ